MLIRMVHVRPSLGPIPRISPTPHAHSRAQDGPHALGAIFPLAGKRQHGFRRHLPSVGDSMPQAPQSPRPCLARLPSQTCCDQAAADVYRVRRKLLPLRHRFARTGQGACFETPPASLAPGGIPAQGLAPPAHAQPYALGYPLPTSPSVSSSFGTASHRREP